MKCSEANVNVAGTRVFVCALVSARRPDPEAILDAMVRELEREGAVVVGRMLQRRGVSRSRKPGGAAKMDQPLTQRGLFSTGKLAQLAAWTKDSQAEVVVIHNLLTHGQRQVLTDLTGCDVYSLPISWV